MKNIILLFYMVLSMGAILLFRKGAGYGQSERKTRNCISDIPEKFL